MQVELVIITRLSLTAAPCTNTSPSFVYCTIGLEDPPSCQTVDNTKSLCLQRWKSSTPQAFFKGQLPEMAAGGERQEGAGRETGTEIYFQLKQFSSQSNIIKNYNFVVSLTYCPPSGSNFLNDLHTLN